MEPKIRVAILDDHQGIIDGVLYRLGQAADIEVVGTMMEGEQVEPFLGSNPVDVLLLDVQAPTSANNPTPYPILFLVPRLLERFPDLAVLILSMHRQRSLVKFLLKAGASGYILKEDQAAIRELAAIIRQVAAGEFYISQSLHEELFNESKPGDGHGLSLRQMEALSLCAAHPDASTTELAGQMNIAHSTLRNLLSGVYLRLNVRTRAAAIARARLLGLISPDPMPGSDPSQPEGPAEP